MASSLMRSAYLPAQPDIFTESSTQQCALGTEVKLADGRKFRYTANAAVALAAGKLVQAAAVVAHHVNVACSAASAIGATSVSATLGATAAAVNAYAEGYMHVNDATGEGHLYNIKSHAAVASAGVITVTLNDAIRVALVASTSEVSFTKNMYKDVILHPSANTNMIVGVAPIAVTASYYFWLQVAGPAAVLTDGTIVAGQHVRASDAVDGAVEPLDRDGTAEDEQDLGFVLSVNADTEYSLVYLQLV